MSVAMMYLVALCCRRSIALESCTGGDARFEGSRPSDISLGSDIRIFKG